MAEGASEGGWVSDEVAGMVAAWDRGEPVTALDVLGRHPDADPESAIRLIYEEACLRRDAGENVDTSEVVRRHPRWSEELRDLFACDRLIRPSTAAADFPDAGETLDSFVLMEELGRGASGRTFLATDPTLADRPVVVKVVSDEQDEHLALAPLRHTYIVPLFSEHTIPERGLRVLCMPYLGGATLAEVLQDLGCLTAATRSGAAIAEVLERRGRQIPGASRVTGPFRRGLEEASYVDAVCWIAACLAEALHHAHLRGIVHMDLKPSNVLITADGQPMLLDFHLARPPIHAGEHPAGRLGGTQGWMAPEQEAAMRAVSEGRPAPADVDGRADVFALGLLLRDALGIAGKGSDLVASRSRLPGGVGVALADVVRKCLAPQARHRYPDASAVAEDLRRHLNSLPLRGVRNRDPIELWGKWRQRHPGAIAWGIAATAALTALTAAGAFWYIDRVKRVEHVQTTLADARRDVASGRFDAALQLLASGLEEARSLPAVGRLRAEMEAEVRLANRSATAAELHALADQIRYQHGIDLPADQEARSLANACQAIWDNSGWRTAAGAPSLAPEAEAQLKTDLIELAAVRVDLLARSGDEKDRREALKLLNEAEQAFGPSYALDVRRTRLVGSNEEPPVPETAWEHDDRGRFLLRSGRLREAAVEFAHALDILPQSFWPNFYAGFCALRLKDHQAAAAAFHTCEAINLKAALCPYNLGVAHEALGLGDKARADYSRALDRDPDFAPARLNRGLLAFKAGRLDEAAADLDRGARAHPDRETLGKIRYALALTRRAQGDANASRVEAEAALRLGVKEARSLLDGR